jgi:hypothetical protein
MSSATPAAQPNFPARDAPRSDLHPVAKVFYNFGGADELDVDKLRRLAASILRVVPDEAAPSTATGAVDGGDVTVRDSWPYGGVHVLEQLWKELDIAAVLSRYIKTRGTEQPFERALFAMVANRALSPYSKLYCWEQWLREEVFLPSGRELELQRLYRAMDFLEEYKAEIEKAVYFKSPT